MNVSHPKRRKGSYPSCQPRANKSSLHDQDQRPHGNNELCWIYGSRRSRNFAGSKVSNGMMTDWDRAHEALKGLKGRTT